MRAETAQILLDGLRTLRADNDLREWEWNRQKISRFEFFLFIQDLTATDDLEEAERILEQIAKGLLSPTLPPHIRELVEEWEKQKEKTEGERIIFRENILRPYREALVKKQLESEGVETRVENVPEEPLIRTRPIAKMPKTTDVGIYLIKARAEKTFLTKVTSTISSLPLGGARGVISLGEEIIGKKDAQAGRVLKFAARIGITSSLLKQAAQRYQSAHPKPNPKIVQAFGKDALLLDRWERAHPLLATILNVTNRPDEAELDLRENEAGEKQKGKIYEVFRVVIDGRNGEIKNVEPAFKPRGLANFVSRVGESGAVRAITQPARNLAANFISWAGITVYRLPLEVKRAIFPSGALEAVKTVAVGPGQTILGGGLRAGFGALGGVTRGAFGVLGNLGKIGAAGGAGGAVAGGGVAAVTAPAWLVPALIIGSVFALIFLATFTINSNQKAYLAGSFPIEESRFIGVSKTASKTTLTNDELPQTVGFTITVTAKEEKLTNVKITDSPVASGATSVNLTGKSWDIPEIENTPWVENFSLDLPGTIKDSLVINTVTVTADIESQPRQTASASLSIIVGNPPQDCPLGPPVGGEIRQGPQTGPKYSHYRIEAIDINNARFTPITATHKGTVSIVIENARPPYCPEESSKWNSPGRAVIITGVCQGKVFSSRYAHLQSIDSSISSGKEVSRGTQIGTMGDSGCANSVHLHYQFNGLEMKPTNIPKAVPYECVGNCKDASGKVITFPFP